MVLRLVFAIPALILTAAIAWAWNKADLWAALLKVGENPWGIVMLIDLYAGFIFTGVIISAIERWKPWTFILMASSLALGNISYAAWAVWRGVSELQRIANR